MRESSRRERKENARQERREALRNGTYVDIKGKRCRNRSFSLSLAVVLFVLALLGGLKLLQSENIMSFLNRKNPEVKSSKVLFENKEDFIANYKKTVGELGQGFQEDKNIQKVIQVSEKETSLKQLSTDKTRSLVSCQIKEGQITKIAAVGIYDKDNYHFARGFKENMLLVTAMAMNSDLNQAERILEENQISSTDNLFLNPKVFEVDGKEFIFHVVNKNEFYFTVGSKTALVEYK